MPTIRIIGPGRAGTSLARALQFVGWDVIGLLGRGDDVACAARAVDALVIATPDELVGPTASAVTPCADTVVLHLSGALGLDVLAMHPRRASLHPLVPLPGPDVGAARLLADTTFAVSGDPLARQMVVALGGRSVEVDEADRAAYHAAACIASNHVVALLGQVERVAASVGLGLESFVGLTRAAVDDVARLGPRAALTGPVARSDWATVRRHLDALEAGERAAYQAGVALAMRLVGGTRPEGLSAAVGNRSVNGATPRAGVDDGREGE